TRTTPAGCSKIVCVVEGSKYARYPAGVVLVLALVLGIGGYAPPETRPSPAPLRVAGLIGGHLSLAISPGEARGAAYLPSSNVLRLPGGELRYVPSGSAQAVTVPPDDPGAAAAAAQTKRWLAEGTVPGENDVERRISERALLNLLLLTRPNGAALAAPNPRWDRVWPRDASFMAVAFAATGHHEESYRILEAADVAAASLGADGLPPGGADYWEAETWRPNLGTAAPLRTGLRAAADLAHRLGHAPDARR
ncbi:MAG: hypothetical protein LC704_00745, partial [Actinobacteria bacterium]|nr:hypothetical protein [Actinomycetota bacterium]